MPMDWLPPSDEMADAALSARIAELKDEHRALGAAIDALQDQSPYDQLSLMRLKRRKLALRDQIQFYEDQLRPDIIA